MSLIRYLHDQHFHFSLAVALLSTILISTGTSNGNDGKRFLQVPAIVPSQAVAQQPRKPSDRQDERDESLAAETARGVFNVLPGFQVELLYTVPRDELGSWVSITLDDKGRIVASDQGDKGLCRITPTPIGSKEPTQVERLNGELTSAQGMLYAFDSLYLSINGGPGSGLYRARDTNGDDQFDEVQKLRNIRGGGEHGPHALRLAPDGKSIYIVCGNHTDPPEDLDASRIPTNWGEDLLLPRQWDARGHARGRLAPGGWIAKTDPEGKAWEIVSIGYRNTYDMDFNADGELFAYDADMEWDLGSPWYRPTRVVHATSGSEFGWRSGTGKWPAYFVDSLPPLVNTGPGSPVGVEFGYGAKFPARYQKALYICDWTFGTMYAVHIQPQGASYTAIKEEFVSRTPLPLTDVLVGRDGAMYFTVGGRGTQSELFRVTYVGDESTSPVDPTNQTFSELRRIRKRLERFHTNAKQPQSAVAEAWRYLSHDDRHIRYAARIALEHQHASIWQDRALSESHPQALITAAVALARQGDATLQPRLSAALKEIRFDSLSEPQQLELLRAWQLVFIRMGAPGDEVALDLANQLDPFYPAPSAPLNRELCNLLVYLKSPTVIAKTVELLEKDTRPDSEEISNLLARNQGYGKTIAQMLANQPDQERIHFALALRNAREGWTHQQRRVYFEFLRDAKKWSGGASYVGFINNIDNEAFENATDSDRLAVEASGVRQPYRAPELPMAKGPGRDWKIDDLLSLGNNGLHGRDFKSGQRTFSAARCVVCHRFGGNGGATGPDLTQVAGRYSYQDISEAIITPSKVISDQYRATLVQTDDGATHTGQIVTEDDDSLLLLLDPEDASKVATISKNRIEGITPSPTSMMPEGLLKPLNQDEILDLLAYLLSRGNPNDPVFRD